MANIDKNIDNNEIGEENNKSSIKNAKEKVKKLSWWAKLFLFCFFSFIFLVVSLLIAINIPSVKDKLAKEAIGFLNKEFKTTFSAENVEINFLGDVVINGVSKSYSMTGWRIGYAVGEPEIIAAMSKVAGQTTSNPTTVAQYAAIEALTGSQETVEIMRQAFEERLNTIYPLLAQVPGFEVIKPQGAFYLFPNVKKAMEMKGYTDVTAFTTAILEEVGVALVTGAGFGAPENVRLSYATDLETLKGAVQRLQQFMER